MIVETSTVLDSFPALGIGHRWWSRSVSEGVNLGSGGYGSTGYIVFAWGFMPFVKI